MHCSGKRDIYLWILLVLHICTHIRTRVLEKWFVPTQVYSVIQHLIHELPQADSAPTAQGASKPDVNSLPPETLAFAERMFDAARSGNSELLLAAVDAGLPANLANAKGELYRNWTMVEINLMLI